MQYKARPRLKLTACLTSEQARIFPRVSFTLTENKTIWTYFLSVQNLMGAWVKID